MRAPDNHKSTDSVRSATVWDLPIRLFHWSTVILIGFAWWSAEQRLLDWHRRAGYAVLCLLLFRVLWGVIGSSTARFAGFIKGPRRTLQYIREELLYRKVPGSVGHNPLGGWSVIALLSTMLLQTLLGLIAVDVDGLESGPLSYLVSFDVGRIAAKTHHIVFNFLLGFIVLHIAAIVFYYLYKNQNLTKIMITGKVEDGMARVQHSYPSIISAVNLFTLCILAVYFIVNFIGR